MNTKKLPIIFIYGPTAVGKTDFAEALAKEINAEIINMDSAQCYSALNVGTAKPDWQSSLIPHHLFDTIDGPIHSSVTEYRDKALEAIQAIRKKGKAPIFVGGSGFYLMSLLYPPTGQSSKASFNLGSWEDLHAIDPDRAKEIHKNDQYRIDRALAIWHETGIKPSLYMPDFNPPGDFKIFFLTRNRDELRDRIKQRTQQMIKEGLVEEVKSLSSEWHEFLKRKKIIGYPEVITYLEGEQSIRDYKKMGESIFNKTAGYAKRQRVFWRMLARRLNETKGAHNSTLINFETKVINLTLSGLDLYIKQLSNTLFNNKK